jgi:hypothetical protein
MMLFTAFSPCLTFAIYTIPLPFHTRPAAMALDIKHMALDIKHMAPWHIAHLLGTAVKKVSPLDSSTMGNGTS